MIFKMKMNLYINVVDEYKSKKILNGRRRIDPLTSLNHSSNFYYYFLVIGLIIY